jgi:hypothetical protein
MALVSHRSMSFVATADEQGPDERQRIRVDLLVIAI